MIRNSAIALVGISVLATLLLTFVRPPNARADPPTTSVPAQPAKRAGGGAGDPVISVWRFPSNAKDSPRGLEVAIWKDGTYLMSASRLAPGSQIVVGKVDPTEVGAAISAARRVGFFEAESGAAPRHAGFTSIRIHDGETTYAVDWTESLSPALGGDLAKADFRAFVATWRRTRAAIDAIALESGELLEKRVGANGIFRGYKLNNAKPPAWVFD